MTTEISENFTGDSKPECGFNHMVANYQFGTDKYIHPYMLINGANMIAVPLSDPFCTKVIRKAGYDNGTIMKTEDTKEVLGMLAAYAEFDGEENWEINHRLGLTPSGKIEIDKGDKVGTRFIVEKGEVTVTCNGAETIVKRTPNMKPLPEPAESGCWSQLLRFLNMSSDEQRMVIAWMTFMMVSPRLPSTMYVYMLLLGGHGSGKSWVAKSIIRRFIDPITNGIATFPKDAKDMAIAAKNAHLLIWDNIRTISKDMSDYLCVACTGGTVNGRALYTNDQEHVLQFHFPFVLTSLHHPVTEADLVSRGLTIHLKRIPEAQRKEEKELEEELDRLTPQIYRGLLDLAASNLANLDSVELAYPARMMGFAKWLAASEVSMGLEPGKLQKAYRDNIQKSYLESLQEDAFAYATYEFARRYPAPDYWTGTPSRLLEQISRGQPQKLVNNPKNWPQNAISLGKRLPAIEKALETQGVHIVLGERSKQRRVTIGMKPIDSTVTG